MGRDRSWLAPLTGVAFFVLAIIAFAVSGEAPDPTEDPTREIVDFYVDNEGAQFFSAILGAIAATLFVFFGGYLRRVLRDAEGPGGVLSAVAFAGARSSSRPGSRSTGRSPSRSPRRPTTSTQSRYRR